MTTIRETFEILAIPLETSIPAEVLKQLKQKTLVEAFPYLSSLLSSLPDKKLDVDEDADFMRGQAVGLSAFLLEVGAKSWMADRGEWDETIEETNHTCSDTEVANARIEALPELHTFVHTVAPRANLPGAYVSGIVTAWLTIEDFIAKNEGQDDDEESFIPQHVQAPYVPEERGPKPKQAKTIEDLRDQLQEGEVRKDSLSSVKNILRALEGVDVVKDVKLNLMPGTEFLRLSGKIRPNDGKPVNLATLILVENVISSLDDSLRLSLDSDSLGITFEVML